MPYILSPRKYTFFAKPKAIFEIGNYAKKLYLCRLNIKGI